MLVSTAGKDPSRLTAIAFVSGVEPFLTAPPEGGRREGGGGGLSLGLPGNALDIGIGLP